MEVFHQYFLVAMGQSKLRELACNNYEKLLKQNLVDRENLPTLMVSTIISACSSSNSQGGSTTGSSSMGSATLVTSSQNQSNYLAALIKTILLTTMQPAEELKVGLGYLLEGTHKKSPAYFEAAL